MQKLSFIMKYVLIICAIAYLSEAQPERPIVFPGQVVEKQITKTASVKIEPPKSFSDTGCGFPYTLAVTKISDEGNDYQPYHLNLTADGLREQGYNIEVITMFGDAIRSFSYSKGSIKGKYAVEGISAVLAVGGEPAPKERAPGMALIGERKGGKIRWVCDGALIARQWVLSAAHCFISAGIEPNVVRLGEYQISSETDHNRTQVPIYDATMDYEIIKYVPYPEFAFRERYHDVILLQLHHPYPEFSHRIQKLCLPWGQYALPDSLTGERVTLTGWGATSFSQSHLKTDVLQQVHLKAFDASVCDKSYSTLSNYKLLYPRGLSRDNILCAGWEAGGRDACKGDSGGPLAYSKDKIYGHFTLVGIVSGGHGCGQKEFPGLYIPIYLPQYLQWIKDVAYSET